MKLPKAIIKKYGITKKAWKVFKGKAKKVTRKVTKKTNRRVKTMARRRYKVTKKRGRSKGAGITPMKVALSSAAYGAFRDKLHSFIPNVGIPYSDSVITGAIGYYLTKKGGMLKNVGFSMLAVESAAIGSTLMASKGTSTALLDY